MALSKSEAKKTVEDAAAQEERICMAAEAAGENAKSDEEASTGSMVRMRGVSAVWISAEMSDTDVPPHGCSTASDEVPPPPPEGGGGALSFC